MEKLLAQIDKCIETRCLELEKETLEKGERDIFSVIEILRNQIAWNNQTKWKMPYFADYVQEKMEDFHKKRTRNWTGKNEKGLCEHLFIGTEIEAEHFKSKHPECKEMIEMGSTFDIFAGRKRR